MAGGHAAAACDQPVHFQLSGKTLLVVGTDGKIDTQRLLERRGHRLCHGNDSVRAR